MLQRERGFRRAHRKEVTPARSSTERHDLKTRPYEPLNSGVPDILINAALELLETSGVAFEVGSKAIDYLRSGGCDVSADGIVRMVRDIVLGALSSSAKSVELWNRDATSCITLDSHHTWFIPGMTCIKVFDLQTRVPRWP
jgi:trimethylamine---corrinoid protein Co-methyltransferase